MKLKIKSASHPKYGTVYNIVRVKTSMGIEVGSEFVAGFFILKRDAEKALKLKESNV